MTLKSRIRSWKLVALGLSQALTPMALAQSSSSPAPVIPHVATATPQWGWQEKVGAEHAWRLAYRGTAEVDYRLVAAAMTKSLGTAQVADRELSSAQTVTYAVDAVLHTRVVAADAKGWIVSARLSEVRFLVDGQADGRRELFEAPFVVHFDATGRLGAIDFMNKYPRELERAVTRLIEPLQVVFTAPGATRWTSAERGADTSYTAAYEFTGLSAGQATLLKKKTAITQSALDQTEFAMPGDKQARIAQSQAKITFDVERREVLRIDSTEQTSLEIGGARFTSDSHTYQATAVTPPSAKLALTLAAAQATLADPNFARARLYDVDLHTRPLVEGLDQKAALSAYRRDVAGNLGLGVRELQAWLRLNPARAAQVAREIDALDPVTDERAFAFGWAALAAAGHPEAQAALLQVVTGTGWKAQSQEQALIALMSLEQPEPSVLAAVWNLRRGLASQADASTGAKLSIATNVYGALGDASKGNPALTAEVLRNLGGLLASGDARQQVLALDALSNVGDEARVPSLATPYLTSKNERVRAAAFSAWRKLSAASLPTFTAAFAAEPSIDVRLVAVRTAAQMPDSEALAQWARAAVVAETHPAVKSELVHLLGGGLAQHAANADVLRALLKTTSERRVRRDIYVYVAPTAGAR